jgi:Glycosyl hydrolases family 16
VTTDTDTSPRHALGRTGRRHGTQRRAPWAARSALGRIRQLAVLGAAISLAIVVTGAGAQADLAHHRAGGTSRSSVRPRTVLVASLRAFQSADFSTAASVFGSRHHHGGQSDPPTLPGSTSPTQPPVPTTQPPVPTTQPPVTPTTAPAASATPYPLGNTDASEPSGMAPPSSDALSGYTESYVQDFNGSSLPSGWSVFTGTPGGDPGGQWGASHVTVSGGMLNLNTWKDPAYNDEWVTGGLSQDGIARTYGAYFVRSRVTGAGPTQVMLLWPTKGWPPEIDFNETGGTVDGTSATLHFNPNNGQDQRTVTINMTQWHTWGVIWTPTSVTYTVDGKVWGSVHVASEISNVPMTLDLTQQTWCSTGSACPTAPESFQVDWVAEYTN